MSKDTLLEFPCDFPIKIMGKREDGFAQAVLDVVMRHATSSAPATPPLPQWSHTLPAEGLSWAGEAGDFLQGVHMRASSGGNYLSVTCTVRASSKAQLDALYTELSRHPMVKVVL